MVFGVWLGSLAEAAKPIQCSTPIMLFTDASPKTISGRTSYYRVRLEFLRYPQLIPAFCTARGFGPPFRLRGTSPWPWIGRPVSGFVRVTFHLFFHIDHGRPTEKISEYALLRLAFAVASLPQELNQATHIKVVGSFFNRNAITPTCVEALTPCKHTVSDTISSPFRATFQLSITVLVHYRSREVFSLTA